MQRGLSTATILSPGRWLIPIAIPPPVCQAKGLSEDGNIFHDSHFAHWAMPRRRQSPQWASQRWHEPPSGAFTSNSSAGRDHSFDAYDDDSDLASIEADIDNEDDLSEHDDMKPSASAEFSNLPDDSIMPG